MLSESTLLKIQKERPKSSKKEKDITSKKGPKTSKKDEMLSKLNESLMSSIESQHEFEKKFDSNYGFDSTYNQPEEQKIGFTNLKNKTTTVPPSKINLNLKLKNQICFHKK